MSKITVELAELEKALEALEASKGLVISEHRNMSLQGNAAAMACLPSLEAAEKGHIEAIATLRKALAQPQQAPAWWSAVENILDEYGLRAIEFVADFKAALEQPQQEPMPWKHDCAALLMNGVELWVDHCPHCGKPRTSPPAQPQQPVAWMHEWADGERIPLLTKEDNRLNDAPKSVRPLLYGDTASPAQPEPVAEVQVKMAGGNAGIATVIREIDDPLRERLQPGDKLYTSPQARKPLTGDQLHWMVMEHLGPLALTGGKLSVYDAFLKGIRATEAAHGIKDTP